MHEFVINNYLSVKLHDKRNVFIYIEGSEFIQCKTIEYVSNIDVMKPLKDFDSVDELIEKRKK